MKFNNLAQCFNAVIMGVQRHKTSVTAVADVHGVNRRRTVRHRLPDANVGKLLAGSLRQGNGARIKTGMIRRLWRNSFHQMHRKLALR